MPTEVDIETKVTNINLKLNRSGVIVGCDYSDVKKISLSSDSSVISKKDRTFAIKSQVKINSINGLLDPTIVDSLISIVQS